MYNSLDHCAESYSLIWLCKRGLGHRVQLKEKRNSRVSCISSECIRIRTIWCIKFSTWRPINSTSIQRKPSNRDIVQALYHISRVFRYQYNQITIHLRHQLSWKALNSYRRTRLVSRNFDLRKRRLCCGMLISSTCFWIKSNSNKTCILQQVGHTFIQVYIKIYKERMLWEVENLNNNISCTLT